LELARGLNDPELFFDTALQTIVVGAPPAEYTRHLQLVLECLELPRERVRRRTLGQFLRRCSTILLAGGLRAEADGALRELEALAARTRDADVTARWLAASPVPRILEGDLEGALNASTDIRNAGLGMDSVLGLNVNQRPLAHLGRKNEALAIFEQAQARGGNTATISMNPATEPLWLAEAGQLDAARESLALHMRRVTESPTAASTPWVLLLYLLEAAVLVGDGDAARKLLPLLEPVASACCADFAWVTPGRIMGGAALLLGKPGEARRYYDLALAGATTIRFRPEIALTRLQLAELLLEHYPDERAAAIEHLDFAIAEFRDMKMQPSLERALRHRELLKA
jgi:hypothetical protein